MRQASGAISFRRPTAIVQRAARRGAAATMEVEFTVPVLAGDPQTARRGVWGKVSAILVKLVKKATDLVVDPLVELAVPWLARKLGVDYLLCVTDLPLRDRDTSALYLWTDESNNAALARNFIFSIWGFDPPLQGPIFKAAFANSIVIALAEDISKIAAKQNEPKFTLGYFNAERDVAHLAGRLRITADMRRRMLAKKKIAPEQLAALEKLLVLFHPANAKA